MFLLFIVSVAIIGFFVYSNFPPEYTTTAKIFVSPSSNSALADIYDAPYTDRAVKTVSLLASGNEIISEIADQTGLDKKSIEDSLKVKSVIGTQIIEISIKNTSAETSTSIASLITPAIEDMLKQIQTNTDEKNQIRISVAEQASVPKEDNLERLKALAVVALIAFVVGYIIVLLINLYDKNIRDSSDLNELALKHLGEFGHVKGIGENIEAVFGRENQSVAEMLREIRASLVLNKDNDGMQTFCTISANPKEGKSSFAASLAMIMSESGKRVVLVDTDLKSPSLEKIFSLHNANGLSEYLNGSVSKEEIIYKSTRENLWIIPSGHKKTQEENSSLLLDNKKLDQLKKWLIDVGKVDYVIFDTSPANVSADVFSIISLTDSVIIIAETGKTSQADLKKIKNKLIKLETNILGVVLSKTKPGKTKVYP